MGGHCLWYGGGGDVIGKDICKCWRMSLGALAVPEGASCSVEVCRRRALAVVRGYIIEGG